MKIALFTDTYAPQANGVAVSVRTLRAGLLARGHELTVFATTYPDAPADDGVVRLPSLAIKRIPTHRFATPIDPLLERRIKNAGFDLIHTHTEFSVGQFGFRAAAQLKLPHVHTYHTVYEDYTWYITNGHAEKQARKIVTLASKYICERCDRIVAPSDKTRALLRDYGVGTPIDVVPTGIDSARFAGERSGWQALRKLKESLKIAPHAKVVLTLCRIAYEKNVVQLLESVADYLTVSDPARGTQRRDVVFLVVGDGPALSDLRRQAVERGIADRVIFTGEVPWEDVPQYYQISDVFVSMSESETQGLTYIESLAAGCPVLARYNECFDGILEDGVSASLFKSAGEFPARLDELLFTDRREDYLAQGQRAVQALSVETFAHRIEDLYTKTCASYVPRPSTLRRVFT
ncbi:MAG: glycosyltransferase family 4 protein [Coriobacteriia bacterium]|nr:glycosyltransferase family 4 protein [Coriobacteriia bacterium]